MKGDRKGALRGQTSKEAMKEFKGIEGVQMKGSLESGV